jgi:hypothetical protein
VITGFNTDIEHDGVVYHVQTEDKGLASPLILSLVYSGGAVLASKRSPYNDLIISGFDEEKLSQRLKHQHRLICAAISAGRIEELKNMGSARKDGPDKAPPPARPAQIVNEPIAVKTSSERPPVSEQSPDTSDTSPLPEEAETSQSQEPLKAKESAYTVYDPRRKSQKGATAESEGGLVLTILDEEELHAGKPFAIRVLLQNRSGKKEKPVAGVTLSLKILGTSFRPKLFSVKTARDGIGAVSGELPHFDSGRAAIVIRAVVDDRSAEIRRVIHPAT